MEYKMNQTYVIVDLNNLALRVRYGTKAPDLNTQVGLAMHVIFASIKKVWTDFNADHVVFALEGRSWRRDYYTPYKANRRELSSQRTSKEVEEDQVFFQALDDLIKFVSEKTNCTALRHPNAEADDMIARWVDLHPEDQHIIVSTDSDFQQLLAPNVKIYNGISALLYTIDGIWDKDGKPAINKKGEPIATPNPSLILFEKIIRGDDSDNVMSAYPGVRKKRIHEAFENREQQGYAWNNLMLSTWVDHNEQDVRVKDAYERNKVLIDLRAQPTELVELFDKAIKDTTNKPLQKQIGINLIKFTAAWGLMRIEKSINEYSPCFSKGYNGYLRCVP